MLHTTIIHELRVKYYLSVSEYCVLDAIHFLSTNPKSPVPGWCSASKNYIAEAIGVSKTFVVTTTEKLIELDLVEKHMDGRLTRITSTWFDEVGRHKTDGKQTYPIGKENYPNRLTNLPRTETLVDTLKEIVGKSPTRKIKKTLDERRKVFGESLAPFVKDYGKEMVRAFFDYWTEKNDEGTKMKFEKEKAKRGIFELSKRLATWKSNESKFSSTKAKDTAPVIDRKEGTNNESVLKKVDAILAQREIDKLKTENNGTGTEHITTI